MHVCSKLLFGESKKIMAVMKLEAVHCVSTVSIKVYQTVMK